MAHPQPDTGTNVHDIAERRRADLARPAGAICQLHPLASIATVRQSLLRAGITGLRVQVHGRRRWLVATQAPERPRGTAHVPDWRRWLAALAGALGLVLLLSAALSAVASIGGVVS